MSIFLLLTTYTVSACHTCTDVSFADPSLNWDAFTFKWSMAKTVKEWEELANIYGTNPSVVHECRLGLGSVFYNLGRLTLNLEKRHNLNQFAMAMVWDVSREDLKCFEKPVWGVDWLNVFMSEYLSLAHTIKRHELIFEFRKIPYKRIAITTVCDYSDPKHVLYEWLSEISENNRNQYIKRHSYELVFEKKSTAPFGKSPVWSAITLVLTTMLNSPNMEYVMWMDCDALFIDQDRRIETLLDEEHHLFISEDGRGLSGGNWIVRNTEWSRDLLSLILSNIEIFDLWDLKDQFALLWSLLRPELLQENVLGSLHDMGYPKEVLLVSQKLLNAYPWSLCRPSHHCFEDGVDFIVSFITLGSQSRAMAKGLVQNFAIRNT